MVCIYEGANLEFKREKVLLQSSPFVSRFIKLHIVTEKGYCMRGDLCSYDHGIDPVVLEDVSLSQVLTYGQGQPAVSVAAVTDPPAGSNGNPPPQHLPLASLPPPHLRNQLHSNMGNELKLI